MMSENKTAISKYRHIISAITADYFAHGRRIIRSVQPQPDYTLLLHFDNGECRRLDMNPAIQAGGVFKHLAAWQDFRRVYLDVRHCVSWDIDPNVDSETVWNNKIDLDPDGCYLDSTPIA